MDGYALTYTVVGSSRVASIQRWGAPAGARDLFELHRTAVFGAAGAGAVDHLGGNCYESGWVFEEVPPV